MGLSDAILVTNNGVLSPPHDHLQTIAHFDPPKGSHLIFLTYTNSLDPGPGVTKDPSKTFYFYDVLN